MYIFLGICLLVGVGFFVKKNFDASVQPVNGEEKELLHLESRIKAVASILGRHTPHV